MSVARRLGFAAARNLETLVRPLARSSGRLSQNYLLPQFQSALGTVVHATPLAESLHKAQPDARIIVAASGLAAQVWQGNRHLDRMVALPSPLADFRAALAGWRAVRLFEGQPYTTLLTTGNERTRITLASALAGASNRIGFAVHAGLVHTHLCSNPALSQIENNLRLLSAAGISGTQTNSWEEPRLYPDATSAAFASTVLEPGSGRITIALATQTSMTQHKKWRDERWTELAEALRRHHQADLLFVGTASEAPAIDALRNSISFPTTSLAGHTTIQQLAAVLQACDLGIMLDTGPLHVARAMQLPTVIIAPAWSPAHEWLPISNPHYRILKNADFPPPAPAGYLIDEVTVQEVLNATNQLLEQR